MTRVYLIEAPKKLSGGRRVTYYVLRWPARNGKMQEQAIGRSRKTGGALMRADAEALRRKKEQDIGVGGIPNDKPRKMTLGAFIEYDLATIKPDVKSTTFQEYEIAANHAKQAIGADTLLTRIGWTEVSAIKQRLIARKCCTATIRKTIVTLRAMFNRARKQGLIHSNVFAEQRLPKVQSRQKRIYNREEVACMVEAAPDLWWKAFITMAVTSGLRKSELLNLMWRDIDFDAKAVTVSAKRAATFRAGDIEYPILAWSAKSHQERAVPLPDDTLALLQRLRIRSGGSLYPFVSLSRLKILSIHLEAGALPARAAIVNNMIRHFQAIQDRACAILARRRGVEVEQIDWPVGCLHDLRRTYGTWMAEGVPMHVLQTYMGHQDIGTTAKFYLGVTNDAADRARSAVTLTA